MCTIIALQNITNNLKYKIKKNIYMKSSSREIHLLYYIYTQMSSDIKKKKVVHQISTTNFKTIF